MFQNSLEVSTYTTHNLLRTVSTPFSLLFTYNSALLSEKKTEAMVYFPYTIHIVT